MRYIALFAAVGFFVIGIAAATVKTAATQASLEPLPIPSVRGVFASSVVPHGATCSDPEHYSVGDQYCTILSGDIRLYFFYSRVAQEVNYVSYYVNDKFTIGQLILEWGTPVASYNLGDIIRVYWSGHRVAYILSLNFRPSSGVRYIAWTDNDDTQNVWRGFTRINRR